MKDNKCPFLEITTVSYCKAFPIRKMIPADQSSQSGGVCNTMNFQECTVYRDLDKVHRGIESLRGFLLHLDYYYHPGHSWIALATDHEARVGIDDFSQKLIGPIDKVTVPPEGSQLKENDPCLYLHSGKRIVRIVAPSDGTIQQVNDAILTRPSIVNSDPYTQGWILSVRPRGEGIRGLFYGSSSRKWLEREVERLQRLFVTDLGVTATDGGESLPDICSKLNETQWNRVVNLFLG